jgi:dihydrofolate reductase
VRKVVVSEYLTLDGVMEDPGGGEKSPHGGWSFPYWNEEAAQFKHDELFASDALLLGRVTYQGFAAAWPSVRDESGFAERMNSLPKFVVSKTLQNLEWNNSHLLVGNIAEDVAYLKDQPGQDILVAGSAQLVALLMQHGLVDEYRFLVHPVILGTGKRLFGVGLGSVTLSLRDSRTFASGIALLIYQPQPGA